MKQCDSQPTIDSITQAGFDAARAYLGVVEGIAGSVIANNPFLNPQQNSCCDIPPACWLPRNFGTYESHACPCGTALLRVQVTNCQPTSSNIAIRAESDAYLELKLTPNSATLGPMERKWFTVAVSVPEDACKGQCYELLVWVAGCNEHYARWTVTAADGASGTCLEARLDDCPDYEHHWYDHFYCQRPCFSGLRKRDT